MREYRVLKINITKAEMLDSKDSKSALSGCCCFLFVCFLFVVLCVMSELSFKNQYYESRNVRLKNEWHGDFPLTLHLDIHICS